MNTVTATTELASTELTTTETTTSELSSDELYSIDIDKLGQDKSNTDKLSTEKVLSCVKFAGAGTVVAAMALFLFEGISVNNDIQRFITILGFGALLSGAGLIVNKWLSDRVASRLFIGLSLISVPVIACVLGGLIYSLTPAAQSADYPMFATWTLADSASLWVAVPLGLGVVSAISALATMIMVRSEVRWMTPALLISTSLLLVPIRDSSVIALLVLFSVIALVWAVRKYQVNPISFQTSEGRFALGVLFLAPVIMIGRTLALYQPDYFMAVCISGMLYGVLRRMYFRTEAGVKPETALLVATAATGFTALTSVVGYAHDVISNHFGRAFVTSDGLLLTDSTFSFLVQLLAPLWALMILLVMFDLLKKRKNWFLPSLLSTAATITASLTIVGQNFIQSPHWIIAVGATMMLAGFMLHRYVRGRFFEAGILMLAIGTIFIAHAQWFIQALSNAGWWGLAGLGMASIFAGAILERRLSANRGHDTVDALQ